MDPFGYGSVDATAALYDLSDDDTARNNPDMNVASNVARNVGGQTFVLKNCLLWIALYATHMMCAVIWGVVTCYDTVAGCTEQVQRILLSIVILEAVAIGCFLWMAYKRQATSTWANTGLFVVDVLLIISAISGLAAAGSNTWTREFQNRITFLALSFTLFFTSLLSRVFNH
jgi:hypothetical protein